MMMPPFAFGLTGDVGVFLIIIFEVIYITIYTWIYIKIKGTLRTMVDIIGDGYLGGGKWTDRSSFIMIFAEKIGWRLRTSAFLFEIWTRMEKSTAVDRRIFRESNGMEEE